MQTNTPQDTANAGFSIVELLISLVIASIALVYLIELVPITFQAIKSNSANTEHDRDQTSISMAFDRSLSAENLSNDVLFANTSKDGFDARFSDYSIHVRWEPAENSGVLVIGPTHFPLHTTHLRFEYLMGQSNANPVWTSEPIPGAIKVVKAVVGEVDNEAHILVWDSSLNSGSNGIRW